MSAITWTKTEPTKDGWYWVRETSPSSSGGGPFVVQVHDGAGYWDDGDPIQSELEFWPEPIEESWRGEKERAGR